MTALRTFNQVPGDSTVELWVESDDSAWAAVARVIVSGESPRKFAFSATSKGPKSFGLASPKVAFVEWTVTFLGAATVKVWTRARRPDGSVHASMSQAITGKAGETKFAHFVVTTAEGN